MVDSEAINADSFPHLKLGTDYGPYCSISQRLLKRLMALLHLGDKGIRAQDLSLQQHHPSSPLAGVCQAMAAGDPVTVLCPTG